MKFFIFAFSILFFANCENKIEPSIISDTQKIFPSQESWNSEITILDSQTVRAKINAKYIATFNESRETILDSGIIANIYNSKGNLTTKLTSQKGKIFENTKNLEASGNVFIVSENGTNVKTETIFWDNVKQKILSNTYVEVKSKTEFLRGYGFESDENLENYIVYKVSGSTIKEK